MNKLITIQRPSKLSSIPANRLLKKWVIEVVAQQHVANIDITLRIVNNRESQQLNETYRHKQGPTNILSFDYETNPVWGDIILCAPLIAKQAREQKKLVQAHWAHLIIHGCLHLFGYDHKTHKQAKIMERKEIIHLTALGFANPYSFSARQNVRRRK
jgi:probable rRNA maturation factor